MSSIGSVYAPDMHENLKYTNEVTLKQFLYVGESLELCNFVEEVNDNSQCKTSRCKGNLIRFEAVSAGLGGALVIKYVCNGCWARTLSFNSSGKHVSPRQGHHFTSVRTKVSLALQVAHYVFGSSYRQYYKTLKMALGIPVVSESTFNRVIEMIYEHVDAMLIEQTTEALHDMSKIDPGKLVPLKEL